MVKKIVYSFIFNMLGLGSLWLVDAIISSNYDEAYISQWALYKSVIFIGTAFVVMGMDQAIVRLKLNLGDVFLPFLIQAMVFSAVLTGGLYLFNFSVSYVTVFFVFVLFSFIFLFYAYERSNLNYAFSQFAFHLWKILLLIIIFFGLFTNVAPALLVSFASTFFLILFVVRRYRIKNYKLPVYKSGLTTGVHFFLSLSSLNIILYLDQLLLNAEGQKEVSGILFSHITFFISPAAILLGFSGFILAPYLREHPKKAYTLFKKYFLYFFVAGVLGSVILYFFSTELYRFFKNDDPNSTLGMMLCGIFFLRYLTIIPSSYLGSFASNALIRNVSIIYHLANGVFVIGFYMMIRMFNTDHLIAIALAVLIAWTIRIAGGFYGVMKVLLNLKTK